MNTILIFKTNIKTKADLLMINNALNAHEHIQEWSVDMEDVDCVLRIVSSHMAAHDVISIVTQAGYHCQELE